MLLKKSIKWGLYLGLAVSLGTQILTWVGLGLTNWFIFLTYFMVLLFVFLANRDFRRHLGDVFSYVQALLSVFIIVIVGRVIFQLYMFLYTRFANPEWVQQVSQVWSAQMRESGSSEEMVIEQIQSFEYSYETIPMFTIEMVKYGLPQFILGAILSVVMILFWKRRKV